MKKIFFFLFPIILYILNYNNLSNLIGTNYHIILGTNIWILGYHYDISINYAINEIIILLPLLIWLFIFIFHNHLWKYFKYYFILFSCFFLFFFLFLIINNEINLPNIHIKLILSKWEISLFLQLLIDDYVIKAFDQNINILNIEILNNDYIIKHLTKEDHLFITSPKTLQIWFNNYTSQHIILDQNMQIILNKNFNYIMYEILFKILILSLI